VRPAAFVDRDGVLNLRPGLGYVTRPEELRVLPHAAAGLRALREAGYVIVVVSNQRGIARGLMTEADLQRVNAKLVDELARDGATIDRLEHCPHDEAAACACRKPRPGMLLRAAEALGLDLGRSLLVGDDPRDLEAAAAAGVPVRVLLPSDGDLRVGVAEALAAVADGRERQGGRQRGGGRV
jgi:D-glycero-D-manno-heptose 1,7-bisphosphate phosphatase